MLLVAINHENGCTWSLTVDPSKVDGSDAIAVLRYVCKAQGLSINTGKTDEPTLVDEILVISGDVVQNAHLYT